MIFNTVRPKLTALVAFSAVAALAMLPILWWLTHRELIEQVHARVPGGDPRVRRRARRRHLRSRRHGDRDRRRAGHAARAMRVDRTHGSRSDRAPFRAAYPDLDLLFFGDRRQARRAIWLREPAPEVPKKFAHATHLVLAHGCELGDDAPVAIAIIRPIGDAGSLMVCLPFDQPYFANAQAQDQRRARTRGHGSEDARRPALHRVRDRRSSRPPGSPARPRIAGGLRERDATWALATFVPKAIAESDRARRAAVLGGARRQRDQGDRPQPLARSRR